MKEPSTEPGTIPEGELSITFAPDGTIGSGGGIHLRIPVLLPVQAGVIRDTVDTVHEACMNGTGDTEPVVIHTPQARADGVPPRCPRKGVQVTKKGGKYPPGHYPNWHHNDPRQRPNGGWYCPTIVDMDKDGEPIWCDWEEDD